MQFIGLVLLLLSLVMNFYQAHVITEQFKCLENDISLFRKNMAVLDSVESRYSRLFDRMMEYKEGTYGKGEEAQRLKER